MNAPEITNLSQANQVQKFLFSCPSHKTHASASHVNLQPADISGNNSLPQNPDSSPNHSSRLAPNSQFHLPFHLFYSNVSSFSTEDETTIECQPCIIGDKRLRRIISNRESARRSRLRKKKQIEELQLLVNQLQTINNQISQRLLHLLENNHQILQENALLKEKVATLHMVLTDLLTPLRNLEDISRNTNQNFH